MFKFLFYMLKFVFYMLKFLFYMFKFLFYMFKFLFLNLHLSQNFCRRIQYIVNLRTQIQVFYKPMREEVGRGL